MLPRIFLRCPWRESSFRGEFRALRALSRELLPQGRFHSAVKARRNLTKGQQAMAYAMIYPEAEKAGRKKAGNNKETLQFSRMRVSQARAV